MSAIGNYIHLKTENYLEYGISKRGNPKHFKPPGNFLQNRLKNVKPITKTVEKELTKRLTANTADKIAKDKKGTTLDMQQKINKVYEILAKITAEGVMGYYQGTSTGKNNGWGYTGDYSTLKGMTLSLSEIERRKTILNEIDKKIVQINKKGISTENELKELIQMYNNAGGSLPSDIGAESILGKLQEAIQNTSYITWNSHISGAFGEHLVALCSDKVKTLALDELEEFLKEAVVGADRSTIALDKSKVTKDLSNYISMDKEGNKYTFGSTQDKVDVKIEIKNQDVFANVKNYYDATEITLQRDVNLFMALAFLESKQQFGTHWLNMHAGELKGTKRKEADEILKQEIAFEALISGNPLKQNTTNANVFVSLDRKSGKAFVRSTRELLLKEFDRIKITPDVRGVILENSKSETIQDRISRILLDAHATQFKVKMSIVD